jgi:2-polyprenyl-3-methyl-5-hydroxy-6-metoxy-1,4-benzoquinol methylase
MRAMKSRTILESVNHHAGLGARVYADCGVQRVRIDKARKYLSDAISALQPGKLTIVELGCGCMDISGPLSSFHEVLGVDCNPDAIKKARELYPKAVASVDVLEEIEPFPGDVLVLCEVLEHLNDPLAMVRKWLPKFKAAVISHPIDEPLDSGLSGGDHCWSVSEQDLRDWFTVGGYWLREAEIFPMGSYKIGLARGVNA